MMVRIHHHQLVNPGVNYTRLSCFFVATYVWRGYFGADSNKFGPCPSHAFRLSEIQRIIRIAIVGDSIVPPAAFIMASKSPAVRPDSMAPNPAPETTSCFAASGAPCPTEVPLLSGVNPSLQVSHLNLNCTRAPGPDRRVGVHPSHTVERA